jgi:hypothetical protein
MIIGSITHPKGVHFQVHVEERSLPNKWHGLRRPDMRL